MIASKGRELSLCEAVSIFQTMPAEWQLASLHPGMVEIDAARENLLRPVHWCFQQGHLCFIHSFHLCSNPGLAINDIQSAYGYGGPLSNTDDATFLNSAAHAFSRWAHDNSVLAEFLRFHPLVPHRRWYAGEVVSNRETVQIDLGKDLFKQYQVRCRTSVRRFLEKDLQVERVPPECMQSVFPALYKDNMDRIGAASSYYFPKNYFDALFHFGGVENWLVYLNGQAIAGAVILVSARARIAEYHLSAQARGAEIHKVMGGLIHVVANYYKSRQFRYFYLGGGRSVDSKDSLLFFKKGFSSSTSLYQTASRVYDTEYYETLKRALLSKAATGRVLFYKD